MAFGKKISQRKRNKQNLVIDLFRKNEYLSKAQVKNLAGYSMDTIISIFESLIKYNLIVETDGEQKPLGRKAVFYQLNSEKNLYVGITFNQSGIYTTLMSFSYEVIDSFTTDLPVNITKDIFLELFALHNKDFFQDKSHYSKDIKMVGLSIPGNINNNTGIMKNYTLLPFLENVNFKEIINDIFPDHEVIIEHNIKSMTSYFLSNKQMIDENRLILYISVRSGIASGIIYNGEIFPGKGEFGHIKVTDEDRECICGRKGCLDLYFSFNSIYESLKNIINFNNLDRPMNVIISEYNKGNPEVTEMIQKGYKLFTSAIIDTVNILNPDLVILSGQVLSVFDDPIAELERNAKIIFQDSGFVDHFSKTKFTYENLGSDISSKGICYSMIKSHWDYITE